jgi:hypothetical protein
MQLEMLDQEWLGLRRGKRTNHREDHGGFPSWVVFISLRRRCQGGAIPGANVSLESSNWIQLQSGAITILQNGGYKKRR